MMEVKKKAAVVVAAADAAGAKKMMAPRKLKPMRLKLGKMPL